MKTLPLFVGLSLTFLSTVALAETTTIGAPLAEKHQFSVGLGPNHGSPILGLQYAIKNKFYSTFISAGLVGYAFGFEAPFSKNKKHTLAISAGKEFITSDKGFAFVSYTYHFKSFNNNGFTAGFSLGATRNQVGYDDINGYWGGTSEREIEPAGTLSLAYKF